MNELTPHNISHGQDVASGQMTTTEPKDFTEGGGEHRKGIIGSTSLIIVLLSSSDLQPALLGVKVSVIALWLLVGASHIYFFVMWRLTATIEMDTAKHFWNFKGLMRQAFLGGTKGFPGKTKAQIIFLRALPIWAFFFGILGVAYGIAEYYRA